MESNKGRPHHVQSPRALLHCPVPSRLFAEAIGLMNKEITLGFKTKNLKNTARILIYENSILCSSVDESNSAGQHEAPNSNQM